MSARILSFGGSHSLIPCPRVRAPAAREAMAAYHGAKRAELVAHAAEAIDRFRGGELEAVDVDEVLFQYSRAAKELWKFCNSGDVELTAGRLRGGPPIDWWERGHGDAPGHRSAKCLPANLADRHVVERAFYSRCRRSRNIRS